MLSRTIRLFFASWIEVFEYLTFLAVCAAGVAHASWRWIPVATLVLFLLGWARWRELIARAGAIMMYGRAHYLMLVVGAKLLQDGLFLTGAYAFGLAIGWLWGVA